MTIRKMYEVRGNQLVIELPENFNRKTVWVTVDDSADTRSEKIALIKESANDKLFLDDIKNVTDDFNPIDDETI